MTKEILKAALDYSWDGAAFAMMRGKTILCSENCLFGGHDASRLADWIREKASPCGGLESVEHWTAGTGPGSFSGLRIASAFVMGAAYGKKEVLVRGMSTASAIVRSVFRNGSAPEKALVLFDGRRSELLAYGMVQKNGSWFRDGFTTVISKESGFAPECRDYTLCALEKDRAAVEKLTKEVCYTENIAAEELILNDPEGADIAPTDLIYLRAAVFVEPKTPRTI